MGYGWAGWQWEELARWTFPMHQAGCGCRGRRLKLTLNTSWKVRAGRCMSIWVERGAIRSNERYSIHLTILFAIACRGRTVVVQSAGCEEVPDGRSRPQ